MNIIQKRFETLLVFGFSDHTKRDEMYSCTPSILKLCPRYQVRELSTNCIRAGYLLQMCRTCSISHLAEKSDFPIVGSRRARGALSWSRGVVCRMHPIPCPWHGFPVQVDQDFHPSGVDESVPDLSGKDKTLACASVEHCKSLLKPCTHSISLHDIP